LLSAELENKIKINKDKIARHREVAAKLREELDQQIEIQKDDPPAIIKI